MDALPSRCGEPTHHGKGCGLAARHPLGAVGDGEGGGGGEASHSEVLSAPI